jgi:hypothetical protein
MPEALREIRLLLDVKDAHKKLHDAKSIEKYLLDLTVNHNKYIHLRLKRLGGVDKINKELLSESDNLNYEILWKAYNSKENE